MAIERLVLAFGIGCALANASGGLDRARVEVRKTEQIEFQADGTVVFKNSIGELRVDAWDQPNVEITTIKSTKAGYDPAQHDRAARELDKVRVSAERRGGELTITTDFPRGLFGTNFDLEYDIKVPRKTRLKVDHRGGEVHADGILGDLQIAAARGEITVHLPEKGSYAIDAKSDFGAVFSDFPGRAKRMAWLVGQKMNESAANGSGNLHLRIGYGDILILRERVPAPLAAAAP